MNPKVFNAFKSAVMNAAKAIVTPHSRTVITDYPAFLDQLTLNATSTEKLTLMKQPKSQTTSLPAFTRMLIRY